MKDENSNYLGICLFFLFVTAIVIGGTFFLNYDRVERAKDKEKDVSLETVSENKNKNKIDSEKDYIYFINEEILDEDLNIRLQYPVINLNSLDAEKVTALLERNVSDVKNSLVRIQNEEDDVCVDGKVGDIKETEVMDFAIYSTEDYVSLVASTSNYSCTGNMSPVSKMSAYTFSISNGSLVEFNDLFSMYATSFAEIASEIRENLQLKQTTLGDETIIQIDETIGSLKEQENYIAYIDEEKNLVIKYIVKTNTIDYNDTIIINK